MKVWMDNDAKVGWTLTKRSVFAGSAVSSPRALTLSRVSRRDCFVDEAKVDIWKLILILHRIRGSGMFGNWGRLRNHGCHSHL
jgi:hypothetical protein